jgi:hypothetical protein
VPAWIRLFSGHIGLQKTYPRRMFRLLQIGRMFQNRRNITSWKLPLLDELTCAQTSKPWGAEPAWRTLFERAAQQIHLMVSSSEMGIFVTKNAWNRPFFGCTTISNWILFDCYSSISWCAALHEYLYYSRIFYWSCERICHLTAILTNTSIFA